MARKKIGGCLIRKEDIIKILANKDIHGIAFKIENPVDHTSVDIQVHGATYDQNGIDLVSQHPNCDKKACRITHRESTDEISDYTFEHMGEFSKFDPDEPLIVYFTRSQIEMITVLKNFEYILVCSYIPSYCDIYENIEFHEPNFSLMIQPYQFKHDEMLHKRDNSKGAIDNGNKTTIIFGAACPKRWIP